MPSLHCHLPQEELEEIPHEVAALQEQHIDENSPGRLWVLSSDDEDSDIVMNIDDTSSEASSMLNDPTIQPRIPEVSLSDENESEADEFHTPPQVMESEIDEMETSTRRVYRRLNTARRARGRHPGLPYERRGRYHQQLSEQEYYRLSVFNRELTFNGFAHNLEPLMITSHEVDPDDVNQTEILYKVKWRGMREEKFIESSILQVYRPQMIIDYWEIKIIGRS